MSDFRGDAASLGPPSVSGLMEQGERNLWQLGARVCSIWVGWLLASLGGRVRCTLELEFGPS